MNTSTLLKGIAMYSVLAAGGYLVKKTIMQSGQNYSLNDKVVLITGGGRGLGIILARLCAAAGAKVVICGRSEKTLKRASRDLQSLTDDLLTVQCDVSDKQQIEQMVRHINEERGQVDVLINNAGTIQVGPMDLMRIEEYESAMNVHFWGPFHLMKEVLPGMKEKKMGRIVNIVSIGGIVSFPHLLPYNSSKHALSGLSKGMSAELKKSNINVTTVYPGLMRTGSPRNIDVKGKYRKEYAWFKLFDSLPVLSMNADRAARKIIHSMKRGDQSLVLTLPAKCIAAFQGIAPGLILNVLGLINDMLPEKPDNDEGREFRKGFQSESRLSSSILTKKTDEAAVRNLET